MPNISCFTRKKEQNVSYSYEPYVENQVKLMCKLYIVSVSLL